MRDPRVLALTDQILVSLSAFALTVIAARTLTTADFSAFSLTVLISMLLASVHRAVITQPLNVLGATQTETDKRLRFECSMSLNLVFVGAAAGVFIVVGALLQVAIGALAWGWLAFAAFVFQEALRRHAYTTGDIGAALRGSGSALTGLFICLGAGLMGGYLSVPYLFGSMAVSAGLAAFLGLRRQGCSLTFHWRNTQQTVQQNWSIARWLLMTVAAVWGASQIYMFLGASLGALAVTYLAVSRNILNALGLVTQTVLNYAPTRVSMAAEKGPIAVIKILKRYIGFTLFVSAVFGLIIMMAAESLIIFIYGPIYVSATPILLVMSIGYVMTLWGTVLGSFSIGLKDSRSNFASNVIATMVTLTLGLWLTKNYQLQGLAWAFVISMTVATLAQGLFLARRLHRNGRTGALAPAAEAQA